MPDKTDLTDLTKGIGTVARDAAYVVVGLGVLGIQRAQVQRVELEKRLKELDIDVDLGGVGAEVGRQAKHLNDLIEGAVQFIETTIEPLEEQLPANAREVAKRARQQAREVRTQIRGLVNPAA